jgi:hypothetical protein
MKLSITVSKNRWVKLLVAGLLGHAALVWAASGEVSASGGANSMDGGVGTHSLVAMNAGFRFAGRVHIFGEGSWTQLASSTLQTSSGSGTTTATGTVNLASFGGGVDVGFGSSSRFLPYIVTAMGVGHFYAKGSASGSGTSVSVSLPITNDIYYGAGAGIRIYAGRHWGFKPEFRYQRYDGSLLKVNSFSYTGGLFWQFGD